MNRKNIIHMKITALELAQEFLRNNDNLNIEVWNSKKPALALDFISKYLEGLKDYAHNIYDIKLSEKTAIKILNYFKAIYQENDADLLAIELNKINYKLAI